MANPRESFDRARKTAEARTADPITRRKFMEYLLGVAVANTAIGTVIVKFDLAKNPVGGDAPNATRVLGKQLELRQQQQKKIVDTQPISQQAPVEQVPPPPTVDKLKAQRSPDDKRNDTLETRIALEVLKDVNLTKDGYERFKANIKRDHVGLFERVSLLDILNGHMIRTRPEFFIYHHTAHVYEESTKTFLEGMQRERHSVPWFMDRNAATEQFTSDPFLVGFWHAYPFNKKSGGVEIETWPGQDEADKRTSRAEARNPRLGKMTRPGFQGDLTTKQYEEAGYLGIYNVHELWGYPLSDVLPHLVGHREINDITGLGTPGKPDFNKEIMDAYRAKIAEFLPQLAA